MPDLSNGEEEILTVGEAELLYKRGEKILRFQKHTWGSVGQSWMYDFIKPFITGRILDVGLGMGISVEKIIEKGTFSDLIVYEIHQDIIDIYNQTHDANPNINIVNLDVFEHKPDGDFDVILFELGGFVQFYYQDCKNFLDWAKDHLEENGMIISDYDQWTTNLVNEFSETFNISYLSTGEKLSKRNLWIVMVKK